MAGTMPAATRPPRPHRRPGTAAALLLACALAGCASSYVKPERFEAPALPAPLDPPLRWRLALADPRELREARPVLQIPPYTLRHRYDIGAASAAVFRQALAATVTELVERPALPAVPAEDDRAEAVLTLGAPAVAVDTAQPRPDLWALRQRADFPVALARRDGSVEHGTLEAKAALADYFEPFTSRAPANTETLRNAAARLIAWLRARAEVAAPGVAASAVAAGRHAVVLRIDAGLSAGDSHEAWLTDCIAATAPPPPLAAGRTPAAALRDALFPWFDPGVLPEQPEAIAALLERPAVRARLAELDVGLLLLYSLRDGGHDTTNKLVCTSGAAGMCIGLYRETQLLVVDAALWDVAARRPLDRRSDEVKRSGGMVGALLPIPFFTSNASQVCQQLRDFVAATVKRR
jgi:hypothetical protein